jgi:hypothetical protein
MPKIRYPGDPFATEVSEQEAEGWPRRKQQMFQETIRGLTVEKRLLEKRIARSREARARAEETLWRGEENFLQYAKKVHRQALAILAKK